LLSDHRALAAVGLITPYSGLLPVQQHGSAWCGCRRQNAP
jgi:hypothetical protein